MTSKQKEILIDVLEHEIGFIESEIENDEVPCNLGRYYIIDLKEILELVKGDKIG